MSFRVLSLICLVLSLPLGGLAYDCGTQAGGALCPDGLCCSNYGWCGITDPYCGDGHCQSQCPGGVSKIISQSMFEQMLSRRGNTSHGCEGAFYTYDAFVKAAESFPEFGTTGDEATRKREIAAFFGQTSHETSGAWPIEPDGPYNWGYCYVRQVNAVDPYCDPNFPCHKKYYARGPIQLTWNYKYMQCGVALGLDLINNPELLETDPVVSFKSAIWFWMTAQPPKPSCHDVMIGKWLPSPDDVSANRLPGYGVITNIINGGHECGVGSNPSGENRIGFYLNYTARFHTDPGDNLDCFSQSPFGYELAAVTM